MILKFFSDQFKFYSEAFSKLPIKEAFGFARAFKWSNYYKETKEKLKDLTGTNYNLALFHLNSGNISDAIMRFKITSYMDKLKFYPDIEYYLGLCYYIKFKYDESKPYLYSYIEKSTGLKIEEAKFLLSAIEGKIDEKKAIPSSLTSIYYDQLSKKYGESLATHEPEALDSLINKLFSYTNTQKSASIKKALDVGCKTGEAALALKASGSPFIIDGIDTSYGMLEQAKAAKFQEEPLYSSLRQCDIYEYISTKPKDKKFDMIVSHDSLNSTPSLSLLLKDLQNILSPKGFIALSLRTTSDKKWSLNNLPFRFSFNKDYISNQIKESGLKIFSQSETSFQNGDNGVIIILTQ